MIEIDVRADLRPILNKLAGLEREMPFVIASSLTKTAVKVKPEIRKEMERVFDRPTRYTLNSIFVTPAKKQDENPTAVVWLKDDTARTGRGSAAATYLSPQVYGGTRSQKPFEKRLVGAGILKPGWFVVPGAGCKLDALGNMHTGQMIAVLSKLRTIRESRSYPNARRRNTRYAKAEYFVSFGQRLTRGGSEVAQSHLARGIWQRLPNHRVIPIYLFIQRAGYRPIFEFDRVGIESARRILPIELEAAIDKVLGTL